MPELMRAQITLVHRNGLPRDSVSMNYWAYAAAANAANANTFAEALVRMFTTPIAPRTKALGEFLGNTIADPGHSVKVYDYDISTGERLSVPDAPPIHTELFALTGLPRPSDSYPSEVALCTTFKNLSGATAGGGNFAAPAAQRRGRTYFGPINPSSYLDETTTNISRPGAEIIDHLGTAHWRLRQDLGTDDPVTWCIYSRPFAGRDEVTAAQRAAVGGPAKPLPALPPRIGTCYPVENISVDNAWDTQRRRGERATSRTAF